MIAPGSRLGPHEVIAVVGSGCPYLERMPLEKRLERRRGDADNESAFSALSVT
jgi:hypothetical protein